MFRQIVTLAFALTIGLAACSNAPQTATTVPATATTAAVVPASETNIATDTATDNAASDCTRLNLNTVNGDDLLATIPNFSDRMVREFEEYRPYVSIQEFRREIGIYVDEATVADYEQYVYVPVDVNESDSETLMQIPGIDETAAEALIAGRPYASTQAFIDALEQQVDGADTAGAACFLNAAQ